MSSSATPILTPARRLLLARIVPPSSLGRGFLAHPLWVGASVSFAVCFALGTVAFVLWRLSVSCRTGMVKRAIRGPRSPEPRNTSRATIFTPMLLDPENLSFIDRGLRRGGRLEVIGRGGCGEVYKAVLAYRGRAVPVAVKKIVRPPASAAQLCRDDSRVLDHRMRQIRSEITTVGRIRHPNLLRLLAHVPRPGCHYLVYEFMRHGSLHDVMRRGAPPLDWPRRLKIALGVADGLEYLHAVHRPRVIHRDLKPGNILLDGDLNARIADFGLAKLVPGDAVGAGPMNSSNVAGTLGYIAPEYYQTLSYTEKSDVYSFGVVLAVLVTGRFPSDEFFQQTDEMCVIGWVRAALQSEDPAAAIDRKLVGKECEEQMLLALKIACFCTYDDPNERPSSRDARHMLAQIKH